jgi:hypothetical protein
MNSMGAAEALADALHGIDPAIPLASFDRRRLDEAGSDTGMHARSDGAW